MSFLYPLYLWALAGISVPLLIHLFGKKKGKPVNFPTLRFLKIARSRTGRARRIEEILVLLLRTLLLALLFLTLAGPVSKAKSLFLEEQFVVFILDDSFSMNASDGESSFQKLKDLSIETLSYVRKPSAVSLVYLTGRQEPFSHDYAGIAEIIEKSKPSFQAGNLNLAVQQAMQSMESAPGKGKKSIFFFTDMQKKVWEDFTERDFRKPGMDFFIFDVGQGDTENLSFKNMYIIPERNNAAVEIKNWGDLTATAEITVRADSSESRKIATFKGGGTELLIFDIPPGTEKLYGEINRRDILDTDNRFFFSFSATNRKKILFVSEDETSPFYVEKAVKAVSEGENLELVHARPADMENLLLEEYQAIFVINAGRMPGPAAIKLQSFVEAGGSMVNLPGERVIDRNFNSDWDIKETGTFLMPAHITGKTPEFKNAAGIGYTGTSHPIFTPFGGTIFEYIKTVAFKHLFTVDRISGTVLLKTTNDLPLLIEKRVGKGTVLLFTFLPDAAWTNMHTRPFFPVMIKSMLNYICRKDADVVMVGQKVELNAPEKSGLAYVTSPDGRRQEFKNPGAGDESFLVDVPGFWDVEISRGDAKIEKTVSANADWEEGNVRKAGIDDIRKKMKGMNPEIVRAEQAREFLSRRSRTSELSYGFLNIILLVFLMEVAASNLLHYKKLE